MLITPSLLLSDLVDLLICWLVKSAPSDLHLIMAMDQPTLKFCSLFSHYAFVTFFIKGIVQPKFHHLPTLMFLPKKELPKIYQEIKSLKMCEKGQREHSSKHIFLCSLVERIDMGL